MIINITELITKIDWTYIKTAYCLSKGQTEMNRDAMKKEHEIRAAKAKLGKLKSLERNIKTNGERIQSEASKSHQQYSSPGCNNSRNAFRKNHKHYASSPDLELIQDATCTYTFPRPPCKSVKVLREGLCSIVTNKTEALKMIWLRAGKIGRVVKGRGAVWKDPT